MINGIPIISPPRNVMFDIDDVCRPLGPTAAKRAGIRFEDMIEFQALKNPRLTAGERQRLSDALHDFETYRFLEFYPGFEKILELENKGARVWLNSNALSQEVNVLKIQQVLAAVPAFPTERMRFSVVDDKTVIRKEIGTEIYIAIDDSPYNIQRSQARFNIMPEQPWNRTNTARRMIEGKAYTTVPAGDMRLIYDVVECLLALPID